MKMKAISFWQPWASLMAEGAKKIETRKWRTHYRGDIVICAAKRENKKELNNMLNKKEFIKGLGPLVGVPLDSEIISPPISIICEIKNSFSNFLNVVIITIP